MVQAWAVEVISDVITDVIERMAGTRGGLQNVPEEGCLQQTAHSKVGRSYAKLSRARDVGAQRYREE